MKLTTEQIRSVTVGALAIKETPAGLAFCRFTEGQIAAYTALSAVLGERAACTTGVRLDFHTNSKKLSFRTAAGDKFEVLIDNCLRAGFHAGEYRERDEAITVDLTDPLGGSVPACRVTLVLPSHGKGGVLTSVELDDGATLIPHQFERKHLFIGDSITQGWDSGHDCYSYAYRVSRHFNAETVMQAVGGAYFHESTVAPIDFDPATVTVAFGTNDFGHYPTYDEMRAHARAFLEKLKNCFPAAHIMVISPIWREHREGKKMGTFENARAIVMEEALRAGMTYIDGLSLVPPMPEFFSDGYLHPNCNGFGIMAENLIIALSQYIK